MVKQKTYSIIYGFAEGRQHGRNLRRALGERGFTEAADIAGADVIIAHSAGCLDLPKNLDARLVMLMNPSVSQQRRLLAQAMIHKIWLEFMVCMQQKKLWTWLVKSFWNGIYLVSQVRYNWRMVTITVKAGGCLPPIATKRVVTVNSQFDPWANLITIPEIMRHEDYSFITYPGSHDQIWITPDIFAGIVQSWYEYDDPSRILAAPDGRQAAVRRYALEPAGE